MQKPDSKDFLEEPEADESSTDSASSRRGFSRETLGDFLRTQRRIAGLSLRQLADVSSVSNAYLSQIERGLHIPSIDVLHSVARGLNVSAETLLDQVGLFEDPSTVRAKDGRTTADTEAAISLDPRLRPSQRQALLAVYKSYIAENDAQVSPNDANQGEQPTLAPPSKLKTTRTRRRSTDQKKK
jgi:transcriptional regulator with XRE-family HTH domain